MSLSRNFHHIVTNTWTEKKLIRKKAELRELFYSFSRGSTAPTFCPICLTWNSAFFLHKQISSSSPIQFQSDFQCIISFGLFVLVYFRSIYRYNKVRPNWTSCYKSPWTKSFKLFSIKSVDWKWPKFGPSSSLFSFWLFTAIANQKIPELLPGLNSKFPRIR